MKNQAKGITLIALVITIIVLLILAGVSLSLVMGEEGMIGRAISAKEVNENAEEKELVELAVSTAQIDGQGTITTDNLNNALKETFNNNKDASKNEEGWDYQGNKQYRIYQNGKVEEIAELEETGRILPKEYQQVEYIESTGTQYIDTGVLGKNTIKIDITMANNDTNHSTHFFGGREGFQNKAIGLSWQYNDNGDNVKTTRFAYGNNCYDIQDSSNIVITQNKNNYVFDSKSAYVNDILVSSFSTGDFETSLNMYIFTCNNNGSLHQQMSSVSLYNCKIYDGNSIVRDYIPCYRISGNVIGLYDTVEGKFYTNQGSGTFLKGNDV